MRTLIAALFLAGPAMAVAGEGPMSKMPETQSAQSWSCQPRKTCKMIGSCEEAEWYLNNCSWGGKLDRDGDGIPCEGTC